MISHLSPSFIASSYPAPSQSNGGNLAPQNNEPQNSLAPSATAASQQSGVGQEPSAQQQPSAQQPASVAAQSSTTPPEAGSSASDANRSGSKTAEQQAEQVYQQQLKDQVLVQQLKARDQEVRQHEQAHAAVGGQYAGSPTYEYTRGPDGKRYAVAGEVSISTSEVAGDPKATMDKARVIRAAALAPAEPSAQDRRVAAEASQMEIQAQQDLVELKAEERELAAAERGRQTEEDSQPGTAPEQVTTTAAEPGSTNNDSSGADPVAAEPAQQQPKVGYENPAVNQLLAMSRNQTEPSKSAVDIRV